MESYRISVETLTSLIRVLRNCIQLLGFSHVDTDLAWVAEICEALGRFLQCAKLGESRVRKKSTRLVYHGQLGQRRTLDRGQDAWR